MAEVVRALRAHLVPSSPSCSRATQIRVPRPMSQQLLDTSKETPQTLGIEILPGVQTKPPVLQSVPITSIPGMGQH